MYLLKSGALLSASQHVPGESDSLHRQDHTLDIHIAVDHFLYLKKNWFKCDEQCYYSVFHMRTKAVDSIYSERGVQADNSG